MHSSVRERNGPRFASPLDAALHALVDMQHAVAGWTDVLYILAGVHAERDQAAGPNAAQRHREGSYSRAKLSRGKQLCQSSFKDSAELSTFRPPWWRDQIIKRPPEKTASPPVCSLISNVFCNLD